MKLFTTDGDTDPEFSIEPSKRRDQPLATRGGVDPEDDAVVGARRGGQAQVDAARRWERPVLARGDRFEHVQLQEPPRGLAELLLLDPHQIVARAFGQPARVRDVGAREVEPADDPRRVALELRRARRVGLVALQPVDVGREHDRGVDADVVVALQVGAHPRLGRRVDLLLEHRGVAELRRVDGAPQSG